MFDEKPAYVLALESAYGVPSQAAFGSAVFFDHTDPARDSADMESLAKRYYRHFTGTKWDEWGEAAWMTAWKEVYARKPGAVGTVIEELKNINDLNASLSVPMILTVVDQAKQAVQALSGAFDEPNVIDFHVYTIGDGGAMSGLLLAGERNNRDAIFLVFLMD
jgi:hypothetical protein